MNNRLTVGVVLASLVASSFAQGSPVAEGARPERLPGDYGFTEGPCADASGVVYFTDQPNDAIYRIGLDGKVELFLKAAGRSNGMTFARDGSLISCADLKNELWSIDVASGKHRVIAALPGGKPFNGPNDAYAMDDGGIYLTDPFYKRDWWDHSAMPQDKQAVYYLAPGGGAPVRVATDLSKPNGIAGTPDGKTLYVADIGADKTWRYRIMPDRSLSEKTFFCGMGSDGMTVDSSGNLYLTGKGVTIFDPEGKKIGSIPIAENWTANVCFGGSERNWLYITASKSVYRLRMKTKSARSYGK
jgi:gluconolactonase